MKFYPRQVIGHFLGWNVFILLMELLAVPPSQWLHLLDYPLPILVPYFYPGIFLAFSFTMFSVILFQAWRIKF